MALIESTRTIFTTEIAALIGIKFVEIVVCVKSIRIFKAIEFEFIVQIIIVQLVIRIRTEIFNYSSDGFSVVV